MKRGFTLIELLVVISIVGLLSSIVSASLNSAREKGRIAAGQTFETSTYHAVASESGGYWNFDEGSGSVARDVSGNGSTGGIAGATYVTTTPSGKGYALSFNGTATDYVNISTTNNLPLQTLTDPNSVGFTMSAWFKASGLPTAGGFGCILVRPGWHEGLQISTSGILQAQVFYSDNSADTLSGPNINDGKWHHLALSVNDSTKKIYLFSDGQQVSSTTYVKTLKTYGAGNYRMGGDGSIYDAYGLIDNAMVFGAPIK